MHTFVAECGSPTGYVVLIHPLCAVQAEVFAYWESWTAHIDATTSINERLLAFMRLAAAGAEAYALSMRMAGGYHSHTRAHL